MFFIAPTPCNKALLEAYFSRIFGYTIDIYRFLNICGELDDSILEERLNIYLVMTGKLESMSPLSDLTSRVSSLSVILPVISCYHSLI